MPEIFADDNGARVIVRHTGPPGKGIPSGGTTGQILIKSSNTSHDTAWANPPDGTDAVNGPASAVNNNVAVFDGTTGKLLKDGGQPLSYYASTSLVATKVDKVTGKGLSTNDFTTELKDKLENLVGGFRGVFSDFADLPINITDPNPGDYVVIEVDGDPQGLAFYDSTNEEWSLKEQVEETGEQITTKIFETTDASAWDKEDCRIYTTADKLLLAKHESALGLLGGADLSRPYGSINYFDMTGVSIPVVAVSDGASNMVKANPTTSFGAASSSFDAGTTTARLRYTGATTKVFNVTALVSLDIPINDIVVVGIARNGAVDATTRVLQKSATAGAAHGVYLSAQISLSLNDYLEVFVGNTVNAAAPTIHALRINANVV